MALTCTAENLPSSDGNPEGGTQDHLSACLVSRGLWTISIQYSSASSTSLFRLRSGPESGAGETASWQSVCYTSMGA